jgi:thiol-disulfide isomerase/thioredoxin
LCTYSEDCKAIYPKFKELATEYLGRALFVKINVDENKETASHCKVEGPENTPTFQFFKQGEQTRAHNIKMQTHP